MIPDMFDFPAKEEKRYSHLQTVNKGCLDYLYLV